MLLSDTIRSRSYIQSLVDSGLLPSFVILMENNSGNSKPGESGSSFELDGTFTDKDLKNGYLKFDPSINVKQTIDDHNIPCESVDCTNVHDSEIINLISKRQESIIIYSGYGGVILKKVLFDTGKYFLHIHGGYLPDFKGSTTNYYSIIQEKTLGASAIFLDENIDSGPLIIRRKFKTPSSKVDIDYIYDSSARSSVLIDVMKDYALNNKFNVSKEKNSGGETYYIIHPVLKHIAILS